MGQQILWVAKHPLSPNSLSTLSGASNIQRDLLQQRDDWNIHFSAQSAYEW